MKFNTRNNSGVTELLILLPIFLGVVCVIAWIGFLLIAKSKMEKHAWVIQTKKTYNMNVDPKAMDAGYVIDRHHSWKQWTQIGTMFRGNLPKAFMLFLTTHTTKYQSLNLDSNSFEGIQQSYNASFKEGSERHKNIVPYSFKADLIIANSPMDQWDSVKWGMYREALATSGFGANYKFRRLGFKEMSDADVPFARAAEMLVNWDLPFNLLDEVE
jgi:hypothetical protein